MGYLCDDKLLHCKCASANTEQHIRWKIFRTIYIVAKAIEPDRSHSRKKKNLLNVCAMAGIFRLQASTKNNINKTKWKWNKFKR